MEPVCTLQPPLLPFGMVSCAFEDLRHSENQVDNFVELHTMWPFVFSAVPIVFASVLTSIYLRVQCLLFHMLHPISFSLVGR